MPLSGSARAVQCILLAVLSGDHALLVGPPGATKSALFFGFLSRFPEARKFQTLVSKFGSEDEYFGPVELSSLKNDPCERNLDGRLTGVECAFLDEVFKGSGSASAQIKLAEWDAARADVDRVTLPERIVQELLRIRNELKANGIVVSDRRRIAVTRVLRAATWLDDCAEVELDHLAIHRRRSIRPSRANHMSGLLPAEQDAGSPITGRTVARWMRQATRRAGLACSRARTPSATRSARTSRCGGARLMPLKELAGHRDVSTRPWATCTRRRARSRCSTGRLPGRSVEKTWNRRWCWSERSAVPRSYLVGRQGLEPWTYGLKEPGGAEGIRGVKGQSGQEGGQAGGGGRELAVAALKAVAAGEAIGVDMLVRLAEQVAAGAGAAPSPALSPRAALVAQLGDGLGAAAAAGDVEAVRVAHEAIGRLLGLPWQNAAASVQAPVVDLTAERGKRGR
ncbi:hypothetical protein [Sorangium sp. So ce693]|uniref:hypothetical protein n=1 Tax=Sorangium sp. So ce693 TaxID=3133318 RepID=UPI003F647BB1